MHQRQYVFLSNYLFLYFNALHVGKIIICNEIKIFQYVRKPSNITQIIVIRKS